MLNIVLNIVDAPRAIAGEHNASTCAEADGIPVSQLERWVFFDSTKTNNVISGTFTKILLSLPHVTIVGLCLNTPFVSYNRLCRANKTTCYFSRNNPANTLLVEALSLLEASLIHKFKKTQCSKKTPTFSLKELLERSSINIFSESGEQPDDPSRQLADATPDDPSRQLADAPPDAVIVSCDAAAHRKSGGGDKNEHVSSTAKSQIIRISGIWESAHSIGLIYKFFETSNES